MYLKQTRNLICLRVCLCMQYCKSIIRLIVMLSINVNVGGVNYRTSGILKFYRF